MKSWLFVGAKVAIIRAEKSSYPDMPTLDKNEVFTIREVIDFGYCLGIKLRGIAGCTHPFFGADSPFDARCFAPVSTINTDAAVEALKRLVAPVFARADR